MAVLMANERDAVPETTETDPSRARTRSNKMATEIS